MRTNIGRILLAGAGMAVLPAVASAQAIYLDVGDTFSVGSPSSAYGAAAGQPGFWNNASSTTGVYSTSGLLDINGVVTSVGTTSVSSGNGLSDYFFDHFATTGDDEALMDDMQDIGNGGVFSETTWTWSGLQNGSYEVFLYAWAPDSSTYFTVIEDPTSGSGIIVGPSGWPAGGHSRNLTYGRFCVNVTAGNFSVRVTSGDVSGNFGSINGWQLVPTSTCGGEPGQGYCDANGTSATPCPCGNNNDGSAGVPAGCANSNNNMGATLGASGTTSLSAADLVLHAANMQPGAPGVYFQGNNAVNGGMGLAFGDGLRCAGGGVVRLQVRVADGAGASSTTVDLAVAGGVSAGQTVRYQNWYRNPNISPCGFLFNLTNGYEVTWTAP